MDFHTTFSGFQFVCCCSSNVQQAYYLRYHLSGDLAVHVVAVPIGDGEVPCFYHSHWQTDTF